MRVKANSTIFIGRNAGSASDFYYQKGRFIIPAGQSVISGITSGMDRPFVLDMEFRRDEKGRQWWSVCEIGATRAPAAHPARDGSYAPHGTNASLLPPPRDLIKKVVQECVCPFVLFCSPYLTALFKILNSPNFAIEVGIRAITPCLTLIFVFRAMSRTVSCHCERSEAISRCFLF